MAKTMETRFEKRSASSLFALTVLFWTGMYSFMSYVVPELERMGTAATLIGVISGIYGFSQMLIRIPLGVCAGRLGRQKPFILLGCAACAVSCLGMYFWYAPMGFLIFRVVCGLAASTWVSFTVMYGGYFSAEEAPRRITLLNTANQTGQMCGYLLSSLVASHLSVRNALLAGAVMCIAAFLMALTLHEPKTAGRTMRLADLPVVCRNRYLLVCTGLATLFYIISQGTSQSFTATLATGLGATAAQLPTLNIVMSLTVVTGNLVAVRFLLPRFGARRLVAAGFACAAVYCAVTQGATQLWMLYAAQPLIGIGYSMVASVLLGQCIRDVQPHLRPVAMGFFQAIYGAGMALGPVISGALIDAAGVSTAFLSLAGISVASIGLTLFLMRTVRAAKA